MTWCPELILYQMISLDGLSKDHYKIRMGNHKGSIQKAIDTIKQIRKLI